MGQPQHAASTSNASISDNVHAGRPPKAPVIQQVGPQMIIGSSSRASLLDADADVLMSRVVACTPCRKNVAAARNAVTRLTEGEGRIVKE